MQHARARSWGGGVAGAEHGESAGVGAQFVIEEDPDSGRVDRELVAHQVGVVERLLSSDRLVVGE